MNPALLYLWFALMKRRVLRFCSDLRRPTRLMGVAAVLGLAGFLFHFREHELFEQLTRREAWIGCALVMLGGSLFKGFSQRGLVFELADIEFLFTGPFTQQQIVFYRLLPNYLFAVVQGLAFLGLFAPHLKHPLMTTACVVIFQAICFHLATGMSLVAGSISERRHRRIRWMMLGVYFLLTAAYLRAAWDIRVVPAIAASPTAQLLFYPAVTLSDAGTLAIVQEWAWRLKGTTGDLAQHLRPTLYLFGFAAGGATTLWVLLRLKANVLEPSLVTTTAATESRLRVRQGRRVLSVNGKRRPVPLPTHALFGGVGAIVWKNLVVARRSRRELTLAFVFTVIFTAPLAALLRFHHHLLAGGVEPSPQETAGFHIGIALFIGLLAFLLQRAFPFDFRCDSHHLVALRTLPFRPLALVLAEIAVPTGFCLGFQALGIAALMFYAGLDRAVLVLIVLAYPAIALAVNSVWNLHYLFSGGGRLHSASAVGTLVVVALSFLVFFPSGWTAVRIFDKYPSFALAAACFLAVQYAIDLGLVLMLAKLFQRLEVSRDFQ